MQLVVQSDGTVRCLYTELFDLAALGQPHIRRASFVEPDANGQWLVDLSPSGGPNLGPYHCRRAALEAEVAWLEAAGLPAP